MRAKQPATQLPPSSLAMTILPSAANDRGRKSRAVAEPVAASPAPAAAPEAVPAPLQAPMEFAGAPAPDLAPPAWAQPAETAAPAWASPPPAPAPAPDWGTGSASRFGNAPAAFGSAPTNPQFGNVPATDYPTNYPAAPGFPPQPVYAGSSLAQPRNGRHGADRKDTKSRTPRLLAGALVVALAAGAYYEVPKLVDKKTASSTVPLSKPAARASSTAGSGTSGVKPGAAFTLPATLGGFPKLTDPASLAKAATALKDGQATHVFEGTVVSAVYRQSPTTDVVVVASANEDLNKDLKNLDDATTTFLLPGGGAFGATPAPVAGVNGTGWITCDTSDFTGLDGVDHGTSTTCAYVTSKAIVQIIVPSPTGADRSDVATAIAKQLS
jgi:hypothetical protein